MFSNLGKQYFLPGQYFVSVIDAIGGTDLAQIPLDEIHRHIGVMPQQPMLFDASILDNIRFGKPDVSRDAIIRAGQESGFDQVVQTLPQGYDTILHNQGSILSQGQRQLLAITRALLSDNDILILDEATSSLDSYTEKQVQQAFAKLRREKTLLIIAHRLSTIRDADYILVMKHGQLVESGSHAELLAQRGYYHRLYTSYTGTAEQQL